MKIIFSLFAVLALSTLIRAFGQTKVVEVDSITLTPSSPLPFDERFILKIPTKAESVSGIAYIEHRGKGGTGSIQYRKLVNLSATVKKQVPKNYILVNFENPDLLNPGRTYSIFWTEGVSEEVQSLFDQYDLFKRRNDMAAFNKARTSYLSLAKAYQQKMGVSTIFNVQDTMLRTMDGFYNDQVHAFSTKYLTFETAEARFNQWLNSLNLNSSLNNNAGLRLMLQMISQKSDSFDSDIKASLFKDARAAVTRLNKLITIEKQQYINLISGIENIDCNICKPTPSMEYDGRLKNIKESLIYLDELIVLSNALRHTPGINTASTVLEVLKTELQKSYTDFEALVKVRKSIVSEISNIGISNLNSIGGDTQIKSFDSRTKLSIAPDFGVVSTRVGKDGSNPYNFVPYLGFHVNFRPLNRDVPFRSYTHKPLHYVSAFMGWSLVNIQNGPGQTLKADSISGYFNSSKGTLLTGLGFRLGNAARLTAGAMYYFKFQENALSAGLFDKRKLKAWPFVGLSIDLALKDLLNGLSDVLTGAPRTYSPPSTTLTN